MEDGKSTPGPTSRSYNLSCRVCPGKAVAEATAFITIASVLHVFNISPYDEREIREIFEKDLFDLGVLSCAFSSYGSNSPNTKT